MTENTEHRELMELIDRMIAGGQIEAPEGLSPEEQQLLKVAAELKQNQASPRPDFVDRLDARMAELSECAADPGVSGTAASQRSWFPRWLTMPRLAAASAALVLVLGVIGLTGAIIRGTGSGLDEPSVPGVALNGEASRTAQQDVQGSGTAGDPGFPAGAGEAFSPSGSASSAANSAAADSSGSAALPSLQKVVQTADYEIEIAQGDFQDRYSQVTEIAGRYGGYVVSADSRASGQDGQLQSGTITIRVASGAGGFDKAMLELDDLGEVKSRKVSGQDVTEQYVDLQSRLRNAQSREASLLALMQKAQSIDEILEVQSRLDAVQAEIEQLQGRINYMDTRTDFATITVQLREQGIAAESNGDDEFDWGFVHALKYAGWLAVQTVNFVIIALAVILPLALMLGLIIFGVYRLVLWRTGAR